MVFWFAFIPTTNSYTFQKAKKSIILTIKKVLETYFFPLSIKQKNIEIQLVKFQREVMVCETLRKLWRHVRPLPNFDTCPPNFDVFFFVIFFIFLIYERTMSKPCPIFFDHLLNFFFQSKYFFGGGNQPTWRALKFIPSTQ